MVRLNETLNHENLINLINNGTSDAQSEMTIKFGILINSCLKEKESKLNGLKSLKQ